MKTLLKKLRLIDDLTIEIPMERSDFVKKLQQNVDPDDTGVFFSFFDIFASGKNEYKGSIGYDAFKLRRRRRIFDVAMSSARAHGTLQQRDGSVWIEGEINAFHSMVIPYYIIAIALYLFVIGFVAFDAQIGIEFILIIPFVIIHAALMLGIPILAMRNGAKRLKYDLEREFYFMTKP
jgi:hypothetical protein